MRGVIITALLLMAAQASEASKSAAQHDSTHGSPAGLEPHGSVPAACRSHRSFTPRDRITTDASGAPLDPHIESFQHDDRDQ